MHEALLDSKRPTHEVLGTIERRLSVVSAARLLLFTAASATVVFVLLPQSARERFGVSMQLASLVALLAYLMGAVVFGAIRRRRWLAETIVVQLLLDQALWTVVVYLSGGVASGATSLYGITCLTGGLLLGGSGVLVAAIAGGVFFSLFALLIETGALRTPADQLAPFVYPPTHQTTYYMVVNILVLVLVALLASYLAERLKRTSGALVAAENRAAQAERMAWLGRLAAGLAHEIRNPLSSIGGAVQILKTSVVDPEDRQLCDIVLREAGRLEELVSDMVDLSRPRPPQMRDADVTRIVSDVVELAGRSGRARGDVDVRRLGVERPVLISADEAQLRQLVWNLVRNAVQASAAGQAVRVRLEAQERVILAVEDDGVGIDHAQKERIFDAFVTTRSHGTGVGLAVVKRIADDHGFGIVVESESGRGATFRLDLGHEIKRKIELEQ